MHQFTALVPAGAEPQTLMVPATYNSSALVGVQVNGASAARTTQTINGRSMTMFQVPPTAGGAPVVVNYGVAVPALSVSDVSVTEGTGGSRSATFTVSLSTTSAQTVTVNVATANGTATAPGDYTALPSTPVSFAPGVTSQPVSVALVTDAVSEPDETFSLNLSSPTNATIADGTGVATIVDDDPTPTLSINDVAILEGTGGTTNATFTVTLSAASGQTVTVNFGTVAGTAVAPNDFTTTSGTLSFAPGTVTVNIVVPIVTDAVTEPNETFTVTLTVPVNATIADGTGVGTIINDDSGTGPTTVTLQVAGGGDDVNEVATALDASAASVWLGNASGASYAGLRFTGAGLPQGATITSARLEVNAASTQWVGMAFEFGIEAALNSQPFTTTSRPSQRTLLTPRVAHVSDQQWVTSTWYALDDLTPIVQALVNQPGWNAGNALALVLRGTGDNWARKFARAFETWVSDALRAREQANTFLSDGGNRADSTSEQRMPYPRGSEREAIGKAFEALAAEFKRRSRYMRCIPFSRRPYRISCVASCAVC